MGQTATDPQTGKRVEWNGSDWVPMGSTSRPAVQAIPGRVDPYRQRADARAEEDQSMQRDRDLRDAETKARQAQLDAIRAQGAQFDLESKQRQSAATGGIEGSVEQGKAAAFFRRAVGSNADYEKAGLDPDSMIGQNLGGMFPNATAAFSTDERNSQRSREREFIAAVLRYDSGAAIPPSEFENAYQTYFPTSSAGPQEIEQKKIARQRAIEGLKLGAGPVAARVDHQDDDPSGAFPGGIAFGDEAQPKTGYRMKPENEAAYQAFVKSQLGNPNASIESINGFLSAIGEQPLRDDDKAAAFIESLRAGKISGGVDYSTNDAAQREELERLKKEREGSVADPIVRGVADTATLGFADELAALGDTVTQGGTYQENLYTQRATDQADEAVNPNLRLGGQLAGALALPSGIGRATAQGGVRAGAVRAGQEGAAFGGAYGFGSGEDMQSRGVNALLGAAGGAAVGYGAGRAIPAAANALGRVTGGTRNALAQMAPGRAAETARRQGLAADASAQGVDLMPADVGGAMVKRFTAGAAQAPASAERVRQAATQTSDQIGAAVARQVGGKAVAADEAGDMVRQGAEKFAKGTSRRGAVLYTRAKELSKGVKVKPIQAIAKIDELVAEAKKQGDVGKPLIKELTKFRNSLSQSGGLEVQTLRNIRTTLRDEIQKQGLRGSNQDRMFGEVLDAASDDMVAGLTNVGKERAAAAYKVADRFWKDRAETIDDVLDPLIGKNTAKSGEAVLGEIEKMAQGKGGGVVRLSRVMAELSEKEASAVRATVIEGLGRATAGTQNAAGDAFSAATFMTNWNKLSGKGKAILFADKELRANLDQIARLSGAVKDSQRFANTSNTAGATIAQPTVGGFIALIPQNLMGRLMTSKGFTGWLARTPKFQGVPAERAYVQRLEKIAAREPVHSAEIIQLKDYLANRIAQSPQQAAANVNGDERDGRQKPPQQ